MTEATLLRYFCRLFKCDKAEIHRYDKLMFLQIGKNRRTENDPGQWYRNGEPYDFAYVEWHAVANGKTLQDLVKAARYYRKLLGNRSPFGPREPTLDALAERAAQKQGMKPADGAKWARELGAAITQPND